VLLSDCAMAPSVEDFHGGGPTKGVGRNQLGNASLVSQTTPPPISNYVLNQRQFPVGVGHTIRQSVEAEHGLLEDADETRIVDQESCCGVEDRAYSVLARLPALHTYGTLAFFLYFGHYWLLLQRPDVAVGIVMCFVLYGIVRFWIMWGGAFHGLNQLRKHDSRNPNYWQQQKRPLGSLDFYSIWHAVIVPNYKEPISKLRQTLDTIASQSIAHQIVICMAMESRDSKAHEVALQLQSEYAHKVGGFCYTSHTLANGEVAGKSSNENWAARCIKRQMVDKMRINPDHIVLTTCDADTFFHPNHFAYVTHTYCSDGEERFHKFYLGVTNFMPNVCHVPAICSARYTVLSVGRLGEVGSPLSSPFPLAIYSLSLRLAQKAAYWDPSVIPEDWHMYFRCVFADQGKVSCSRLMLTVGTEAVEGCGYFDTLKECYQQSVRWQWGAVDVGYLLVQSVSKWDVPLLTRLSLLLTAYDHHMLVVVMCISLAAAPWLYGSIPVMVDLDFITGNQSLVALKDIMICTWAVHFFFHYFFLCYTDRALRTTVLKDRMYFDVDPEEHPSMGGCRRYLTLLLFPLADFLLFVIPTIHAHTKLFISSSFNYVPSAKQGARAAKPKVDDAKI
jgi:cellulose synthase/poly-beta-1,6-N-acetylglucosamine synthase-like glycosyltransferase